MINDITTAAQYDEAMASIEKMIDTATQKGGFEFLSEFEKEELEQLSLLVEQYEDKVLKLMPLTEL